MIKKQQISKALYSLTGVIKRHPDGFGFFIPEDSTHLDVYLPRKQMQGLMNNDIIKINVFSKKDKFYGELLTVVKHSSEQIIGKYFPITNTSGIIKDDNGQWGEDLKIHLTKNQKVQKGTWVQVKINDWPCSVKGFNGDFICALGVFPDAWEDNIYIVKQHNISILFSEDCVKEAEAIPKIIPQKTLQLRKDLTTYPFITIDGKTAQDFDDAIYVSSDNKGTVLYVAIADVSHYVKKDSPLDKNAYQRGNSTYFPNYTLPMLPEKLSNDLCSLKPHQKRLVFVAEIHFNHSGEKQKAQFYEAVIESKNRFTYGEVEDLNSESKNINKAILDNVLEAKKLARELLNQRLKNNFINLDIPETQITLNSAGEPTDITQHKRLFAHQLIEELMLAANKAVAEYIYKNKTPSIYRIHDLPKEKALKFLESFIQKLGSNIKLEPPDLQKNISHLIKHFADHPLSNVLQTLVLRSLSQALYKVECKPHFGLNIDHYTHFTSPIRRYSDLMVHRILKTLIAKQKSPYKTQDLESMATTISACEQRSVKAERQIKDIKRARFIKKYLGKEMAGSICAITRFGFFVKLKLYDIDGLVHINNLNGAWVFEESVLELQSKVTGQSFRIGDLVLIQVVASNIDTGQIDFDLKQHKGKPYISKSQNEKPIKKSKYKKKKHRKRKKVKNKTHISR